MLVACFTHILLNKTYPLLADKGTCRLQDSVQSRVRASHINKAAIKPKNMVRNIKSRAIRVDTLLPFYFLSVTNPFRGLNKSLINGTTELLVCRDSLKESFLKGFTILSSTIDDSPKFTVTTAIEHAVDHGLRLISRRKSCHLLIMGVNVALKDFLYISTVVKRKQERPKAPKFQTRSVDACLKPAFRNCEQRPTLFTVWRPSCRNLCNIRI